MKPECMVCVQVRSMDEFVGTDDVIHPAMYQTIFE